MTIIVTVYTPGPEVEEVETPGNTVPGVEIGSRWVSINKHLDDEVEIVYVSSGNIVYVHYTYDDGSGCAQCVEEFLDEFSPVVPPITMWTYLFTYKDGRKRFCENNFTSFEAAEDNIQYFQTEGMKVKIVKVELQPEE